MNFEFLEHREGLTAVTIRTRVNIFSSMLALCVKFQHKLLLEFPHAVAALKPQLTSVARSHVICELIAHREAFAANLALDFLVVVG